MGVSHTFDEVIKGEISNAVTADFTIDYDSDKILSLIINKDRNDNYINQTAVNGFIARQSIFVDCMVEKAKELIHEKEKEERLKTMS